MDKTTQLGAIAWIAGGTAWAATALLGLRAGDGSGGFYIAEASWLIGRGSTSRCRSTPIERSQPMRSATTVAGMSGQSRNTFRISGSTTSTIGVLSVPLGDDRPSGGESLRSR